MSFPSYPKYKDSSIEWLGEVPEQWQTAPLKSVSTYNDEVLEETTAADTEIVYVDISSVDGVKGITAKETMLFSAAPSRARRRVRHGDVIVSTVRTYLKAIARIRDPEENLIVSTGFAVIRPKAGLKPDYLGYLVSASHFVEQVIARSTGVSYPAINGSELVSIHVPVPPVCEQASIAVFLDQETEKTDALIAEQQRLIELLKEKRQAVISHAVTKGLNPHVPMKSSGIEWLGDVPAHWEIKRFKRIVDLIDGDRSSAYPSDQDIIDEGIPFLSSKNIVGYKFRDTDMRFISQVKFDSLSRGKIRDGDLAMTVRGTIGHVAIYDAELLGYPTAFINAQMMIIRPTDVSSSFVHSISESHYWQKQLDVASYGTAQQQLSNTILQNIFVVIPPCQERDEIDNHLEVELKKFDALTAEAQHAIGLLQERRSALISAAVTGKIDVRPLTDNQTL